MKRVLLLLLLLAIPAIAVADKDDRAWVPKTVADGWSDPYRDRNTQGGLFQGGLLESAVFRGAPANARKAGDKIAGLKAGGRTIEVTVASIATLDCMAGGSPLTLYTLKLPDGSNPCAGVGIARDRDAPRLSACERAHFDELTGRAVAVPGAWGKAGAYVASKAGAPFFTFSCFDGAVAKCVRWGYRADVDPARSALHQACVRAARADYCGTGRAFTCPGNTIDIVDGNGVQARAADTQGEALEAGWTPDGAVCLDVARMPGCGSAAQQDALKRFIRARCGDARHLLAKTSCAELCKPGASTCGLLRTYAVAGGGTACGDSKRLCVVP